MKLLNNTKLIFIINTFILMLFGFALGIWTKWLSVIPFMDDSWYKDGFDILDLANVFTRPTIWIVMSIAISIYSKSPKRASISSLLFFISVTVGYYFYSIYMCGTNPAINIFIWLLLSLLSSIFAYFVWYSIEEGLYAKVISIIIISVLLLSTFNIGIWYIDFKSLLEPIIFAIGLFLLCDNKKEFLIKFNSAFALTFLISIF